MREHRQVNNYRSIKKVDENHTHFIKNSNHL